MMNVLIRVQFDSPTAEDWRAMRSLAGSLTDNQDSVHVTADATEQDWVTAEFTMPTDSQYKAVDRIDCALRFAVLSRMDSTISFPKTAAEQAHAQRKNERRKWKRRRE